MAFDAYQYIILPVPLFAARNVGNRLRDITRHQLDIIAKMNAVMQEVLNISGALLVKLFGHTTEEDNRFKQRLKMCAISMLNAP